MNYRHHFHAGNFADVFKHALLVQLVRAMQRKAAGALFLDTHAGAGGYDLTAAGAGDSRPREPEYPGGIGRLWEAQALPGALEEYVGLVRDYQKAGRDLRFYPGSPWFLRRLLRPQDRLAACESEPDAFRILRRKISGRGVLVRESDGYDAVAAMLPPPERRALVLIDPPFEQADEWARIESALRRGGQRLPAGLYAVWYPLSGRAAKNGGLIQLKTLGLPPTLAVELTVNPDAPGMNGCGLLIVNPPWRFGAESEPWLRALAGLLGQTPKARAELRWIVPE